MHKQAKIIKDSDIRRIESFIKMKSTYPDRDLVIFYLSRYAALRACEISNVTWDMILDSQGNIGTHIELRSKATKGGYGGGSIPIHPQLREALQRIKDRSGHVIKSQRGSKLKANSIVNWFRNVYASLNLTGCSSHSGRRTFITNAARKMREAGASISDIKGLARHKSITTTQRYIDECSDAKERLVLLQ